MRQGPRNSFFRRISTASVANTILRHGRMHELDYLREEAVKYRQLADAAEALAARQEFLELAAVCDEVANEMDDRRASG